MSPSEVDGCVVVPADDNTVGVAEARAALLSSEGVQPSLVPERWVENAFRHVVWKLAAYERQFPDEMAGRYVRVWVGVFGGGGGGVASRWAVVDWVVRLGYSLTAVAPLCSCVEVSVRLCIVRVS